MGCEYKDACLMGGSELWGVYMHDRNNGRCEYKGCMSMGGQ